MSQNAFQAARTALQSARRVVVFTGAGVSAESGIPTFRDEDGFWRRFPPEQFARWQGLFQLALTEPRRVAEFGRHVVEPIALARPNPAHRAIAALEKRVVTHVVTQNIDALHQEAGSSQVSEIHGSLLEVVDIGTGNLVRRFSRSDLLAIAETLKAFSQREMSLWRFLSAMRRRFPFDLRGRHRPNLVLFGDSLAEPAWTEARRAVDASDVLLMVGTSAEAYPAALLPDRAAQAGATVISVDPHPSQGLWLAGRAATVLPLLVAEVWGEA